MRMRAQFSKKCLLCETFLFRRIIVSCDRFYRREKNAISLSRRVPENEIDEEKISHRFELPLQRNLAPVELINPSGKRSRGRAPRSARPQVMDRCSRRQSILPAFLSMLPNPAHSARILANPFKRGSSRQLSSRPGQTIVRILKGIPTGCPSCHIPFICCGPLSRRSPSIRCRLSLTANLAIASAERDIREE